RRNRQDVLVDVALVEVRQQVSQGAHVGTGEGGWQGVGIRGVRADVQSGREASLVVVVLLGSLGNLSQIVLAAHAVRGLTDFLHSGQQQAEQDSDDGKDHQ